MSFVKIKLSVGIKSKLSILYPPSHPYYTPSLLPYPCYTPFLLHLTTTLLTTLPLLHPLRTPQPLQLPHHYKTSTPQLTTPCPYNSLSHYNPFSTDSPKTTSPYTNNS